MADEKRFILTEKNNKTVTLTIRVNQDISTKLEKLSKQSKRSRNEIINLALEFALNDVKFIARNE